MKKIKLGFIVFTILVLIGLVSCNQKNKNVEPPEEERKVNSVEILYNDQTTNGIITVDISAETITLKANVHKSHESVSSNVAFTSSDILVATVNDDGIVTFHGVGETIITATAGDKTSRVVLVINDTLSSEEETFTVTVIGGRSDKSKAATGEYVTLIAEVPEHMEFVRWDFRIDGKIVRDVWTNGNVFQIENNNIEITAVYEEKLYTLNVVGGIVVGETLVDYIESEDRSVYEFSYGTEVNLRANDEPSGTMFVGWDYQAKNNRVGDLGSKSLDAFNMPDETLTVWSVFSEKSTLGLPPAGSVPFNNVNDGFKVINNGIPEGENVDSDLDEMSGYRFAIPSTASIYDEGDYSQENVMGSNLANGEKGSYTLKAIFKNHHKTLPVTVEFYATYYGARTTTGLVTIMPGEVLTKYFLASLGFDRPWMGFVVRKPTNLSSGDVILLDMVVQKAPTYPEGDKQFEISGRAEWVSLTNYTAGNGWQGHRPMIVNNNLGMSMIAAYADNIPLNGYIVAGINNLPTYDSENPNNKIYVRVINATNNIGQYRFQISSTNNPLDENGQISHYDVKLEANEVEVFAISVPRDVDVNQLYFSIVKDKVDGGALYGHNIVLQLAYNNIFNVQE